MNKTNRASLSAAQLKKDWPLIVLILALFVVGAYYYPQLPERVPSHWNIQGEVDGYSGRFFGAFGLPATVLGIYVLMLITPGLDPRRENYKRFGKTYDFIRWLIVVVMSAFYIVVLLKVLGHDFDIGRLVQPIIAVLFIFLGNQLGRLKHNYFIGIRTPWTLASEEVWRKTHRFAGPVWVSGGIVGLLATWLPVPFNFWTFMVAIFTPVVVTFAYSYVAFQRADDNR